MSKPVFLKDASATHSAGKILGEVISCSDVSEKKAFIVFLNGVLGAGKTSFCGGVLAAFEHSGPVKSPTYTLVEPYEMPSKHVYHFDLYRLGDPQELDYMGIRDYFSQDSIALIEWPERGRGFLPDADLIVSLSVSAKGRDLMVNALSSAGNGVLTHWQKLLVDSLA